MVLACFINFHTVERDFLFRVIKSFWRISCNPKRLKSQSVLGCREFSLVSFAIFWDHIIPVKGFLFRVKFYQPQKTSKWPTIRLIPSLFWLCFLQGINWPKLESPQTDQKCLLFAMIISCTIHIICWRKFMYDVYLFFTVVCKNDITAFPLQHELEDMIINFSLDFKSS